MIKIAPSILSADFANLERDIHRIADADYAIEVKEKEEKKEKERQEREEKKARDKAEREKAKAEKEKGE